ncbi:MarR family winged helix-turn-helix transcriptional regulator [Nostocoides sp.]|uniref:MarR family winged helix-turn-helix transcriptional regulator n=1 Tax=Nostocoides sp. TaxID=1917966 RepID=UPI002B5EFD5D|nr:MarR family transcriptional regulator [Tetrasphaera sp.]
MKPPVTTAPASPATDVAELATTLRLACMRISRRVRFESADAIAPHHFSVLVHLEKAPRTPGELASVERVSAPSMTRTLRGLVELGYAVRSADASDRRCVQITITPLGRQVVSATRESRNEWMAARVAKLSAAQQRLLQDASAILDRLAAQ